MRFPMLFLFVIITLHSTGQDVTSEIKSQWLNLKSEIQNRSKVVDALTNAVLKSKVDKKKVDNLKRVLTDLSGYIDTLNTLDSTSISLTEMKNIKLILAIQGLLIEIENHPTLKSTQKFANLQGQLEGCENRIAQSVNSYNDICYKYKRADLIFHRTNQKESTEIKF
ncbi:MAG: LemA family protein [Ferruginibacter sp.]